MSLSSKAAPSFRQECGVGKLRGPCKSAPLPPASPLSSRKGLPPGPFSFSSRHFVVLLVGRFPALGFSPPFGLLFYFYGY